MRRAALVTGGTGAIGLAVARVLGEAGYGVTLNAPRNREVEAGVESLRAEGHAVVGARADLAEECEAVGLIAAHRKAWGRLDMLVNNAGLAMVASIDKIDTTRLDRLLAVNLRAAILMTREALPLLREAGAEHGEAMIVNTASLAGTLGVSGISVYAATKRGMITFTHSTQREVAGEGIRCTALAPGVVDTAMTASAVGEIPPERMLPATDVGEAMRFLLRTSRHCRVPQIVCTASRQETSAYQAI